MYNLSIPDKLCWYIIYNSLQFSHIVREIIIVHLHSWGHSTSRCKARKRHQEQHRDWVWRDRDPLELFSCTKPWSWALGDTFCTLLTTQLCSPFGCSGSCHRSLFQCRDVYFATSCFPYVLGTLILPLAHIFESCWLVSLHPFQNLNLVLVSRLSLNLSAK